MDKASIEQCIENFELSYRDKLSTISKALLEGAESGGQYEAAFDIFAKEMEELFGSQLEILIAMLALLVEIDAGGKTGLGTALGGNL